MSNSQRQLLHRLVPVIALLAVGAALWLLHHELAAYRLADIRRSLQAVPTSQLLTALGLTVASYVLLTGYDTLALRYLGRPLPYGRTALASFLGYVFSHNLGLSVLGGAMPRSRLYSSWGLSAVDIATLVGFVGLTFWLGVLSIGGVALVVEPRVLGAALRLPPSLCFGLGVTFVAVTVAYLALAAVRREPLRIRTFALPVPPFPVAVAQVALSVVDWCVAAAVLYSLLPSALHLTYGHFLGVFVLAQIAGFISHVPGGLGVFESVMLVAVPHERSGAALVAALLAYRVIYYLLPLAAATLLLAGYEVATRRARWQPMVRAAGRWVPAVVPSMLAVTTFGSGLVLLFVGATPVGRGRLTALQQVVPLSFLELSHFLGSLVGIALLLVASGLQRRIDAAYHAAVVLLGLGAVFALLKGVHYEAAVVLLFTLATLVPCRGEFRRHGSLLHDRLSPGWTVAVATAIGTMTWLVFFAYRHVQYGHELWWQFSFGAQASRAMRASVGVVAFVFAVALARILGPARPRRTPLDAAGEQTMQAIVRASPEVRAWFALLGDKSFLMSPDGRAFIMYAVQGRSWVALGDPVGPADAWEPLLWHFVELCDRYGGEPVFYEARASALPAYVDMGLVPLKFGEEARVRLADFSLEGPESKQCRQTLRRMEREGLTFEVLPPTAVDDLLPQLQAVSDAWLRDKRTREKSFSLGRFDAAYLRNFPLVVLRRDHEVMAFANLLCGADHYEVSPDLMRHVAQAPHGVMDMIFLHTMQWAKAQGYEWFNLGMAPLSGLEQHALAPLWHRLGSFVYGYGEHFYNFQGLRQYKEKFNPQWEPRYLVAPGGLVLVRVLADVGALVSGGLTGLLVK